MRVSSGRSLLDERRVRIVRNNGETYQLRAECYTRPTIHDGEVCFSSDCPRQLPRLIPREKVKFLVSWQNDQLVVIWCRASEWEELKRELKNRRLAQIVPVASGPRTNEGEGEVAVTIAEPGRPVTQRPVNTQRRAATSRAQKMRPIIRQHRL